MPFNGSMILRRNVSYDRWIVFEASAGQILMEKKFTGQKQGGKAI